MLLIITYSRIVFWLILSVTWEKDVSMFMRHVATEARIQAGELHCYLCSFFFSSILSIFLTVTKHSNNFRQRLLRLSELSPQRRLSNLSMRSWRRHKLNWINSNKIAAFSPHLLCLLHVCLPFFKDCLSRTFILCSALSKPMSMLMMSKPDADLFFWWTPRKSAHSVWRDRQRENTLLINMKCFLNT